MHILSCHIKRIKNRIDLELIWGTSLWPFVTEVEETSFLFVFLIKKKIQNFVFDYSSSLSLISPMAAPKVQAEQPQAYSPRPRLNPRAWTPAANNFHPQWRRTSPPPYCLWERVSTELFEKYYLPHLQTAISIVHFSFAIRVVGGERRERDGIKIMNEKLNF